MFVQFCIGRIRGAFGYLATHEFVVNANGGLDFFTIVCFAGKG